MDISSTTIAISKKLQCVICSELFDTEEGMKQHEIKDHPKHPQQLEKVNVLHESDNTETKNVVTDVRMNIESKGDSRETVTAVINVGETNKSLVYAKDIKSNRKKEIFKCRECHKGFRENSFLEKHLQKHHALHDEDDDHDGKQTIVKEIKIGGNQLEVQTENPRGGNQSTDLNDEKSPNKSEGLQSGKEEKTSEKQCKEYTLDDTNKPCNHGNHDEQVTEEEMEIKKQVEVLIVNAEDGKKSSTELNERLSNTDKCLQIKSKENECSGKQIEGDTLDDKQEQLPGELHAASHDDDDAHEKQPTGKEIKIVENHTGDKRQNSNESLLNKHESDKETRYLEKEENMLVKYQLNDELPVEWSLLDQFYNSNDYVQMSKSVVLDNDLMYECDELPPKTIYQFSSKARSIPNDGTLPLRDATTIPHKNEKHETSSKDLTAASKSDDETYKPSNVSDRHSKETLNLTLEVHDIIDIDIDMDIDIDLEDGEIPSTPEECTDVINIEDGDTDGDDDDDASKLQVKNDRKGNLNSHQCEKYLNCRTCGKTFFDKHKLKQHEIIHYGTDCFRCKQCGREFRTKGRLQQHELDHTDNYRYSCETCGKGFKRKISLEVHEYEHTVDRPYECKAQQHINDTPYQCKKCGWRFRDKDIVRRHEEMCDKTRQHSSDSSSKRDACDKTFGDRITFLKDLASGKATIEKTNPSNLIVLHRSSESEIQK